MHKSQSIQKLTAKQFTSIKSIRIKRSTPQFDKLRKSHNRLQSLPSFLNFSEHLS
jgi:ribosomal protein RSM22 (predicted rRNA methylase)